MKPMKSTTSIRLSFVIAAVLLAAARGQSQAPAATVVNTTATLRADAPGPVVHRNVYGHFAEHLGRGIYEGIWVGPARRFPIPAAFATTSSPR